MTTAQALRDVAPATATELVERIRDGDPSAEARLVERHSHGLRYLLLHLTGDPVLADDLHQDTFRIVLEKVRAGDLREPEKLAGFLRGTARHLVTGAFRQSSRHPQKPLEDMGEPQDEAPDPLGRLLIDEDRLRVRRLLGELPSARDREILFRFHIAEEPKARICEDLGLTSRQFNLVLHRARRRFRELLPEVESGRG